MNKETADNILDSIQQAADALVDLSFDLRKAIEPEEVVAEQEPFKVGDLVVDGLGKAGFVEALYEKGIKYPVRVIMYKAVCTPDGNRVELSRECYTQEGKWFDADGIEDKKNIKPITFPKGAGVLDPIDPLGDI